ncbi:protein SPO16 homolog [Dromiciops gliroides]|uniref:protein SPO16 homolog n=1 Tax=Dromiciops gliroides TaxID=33562 RepID=UPI001CC37D90|nr:protein SPO16 homolog [Dromiciops gliroides]
MAESSGKEKVKWVTTIIMSSSLQSHEVAAIFKNENHRIRYSNSVEPGSIIFSLSGVAFLLRDAQDCLMTTEETLLAQIEKFIRIHRNSFLALSAAFHGPREWQLMSRIQQRFLGDNLRIIPVHSPSDAVKLMTMIAKSTCKPYIDNIHYRMIMAKAQIIEQSPVWKTLHKIQLNCDSLNMN